jgi:hypothetical protein
MEIDKCTSKANLLQIVDTVTYNIRNLVIISISTVVVMNIY